jgi:HEPN domain-containing protein
MAKSSYLLQAGHNLEVAEKIRQEGYFGWSAFVAGQAGETAVKGVLNLLHHGNNADWDSMYGESKHRMDRLICRFPRLVKTKSFGSAMQKGAEELSRHFIAARYPADPEDNPPFRSYRDEDAETAIKSARELVAACSDLVAGFEAAFAQKK